MRVTKYYDPIESQKVKLTDKIEVKTKNRRVLVVQRTVQNSLRL